VDLQFAITDVFTPQPEALLRPQATIEQHGRDIAQQRSVGYPDRGPKGPARKSLL
jgi:hypothetical protein